MREFIEDNRKHWEELAKIHPKTDYYDVESFLNGESTLDSVEPEELGDVGANRCCIYNATSASIRCRGHVAEPR